MRRLWMDCRPLGSDRFKIQRISNGKLAYRKSSQLANASTSLFCLARQRLRAAERAMRWGKHCKIRRPDKEDAFPMGVSRAGGGATPNVAVYRVQRAMPCVRTDGNQRAEFFSSHPLPEPPHLGSFLLENWAGPAAIAQPVYFNL